MGNSSTNGGFPWPGLWPPEGSSTSCAHSNHFQPLKINKISCFIATPKRKIGKRESYQHIVVHIYTYQDCSMIFGVSVAVLPGWQGHCGHGPGC